MALLTEIITPASLAAHVGGDPADTWIIECAAAANAAVLHYLGREYESGVGPPVDPPLPTLPPEVETATLTAGADMYHRRQAPLGISSALDLAGVPLRVTRDWLGGVTPMLDRYRDLRQGIG
jgi:hypothetical protein